MSEKRRLAMQNRITYCSNCIMPSTKPDLQLDADGVCSACRYFEGRDDIDWGQRQKELERILAKHKDQANSNYDCIIPVSGGKDSTFAVVRMLQMGMTPLCVTATTDKLSDLGRRNLDNIKSLGVDHYEVSTNPIIRRNINKFTLKNLGDISWPEHVTIFTIPVRVAVQLKVPLIIWGENSQNENGGPLADAESSRLTRRWLEEFGGMLGLRVSDLIAQVGISEKELIQYQYPEEAELERLGITGLFLGHYFPWDGHNNAFLAQAYGFESHPTRVEGSLVNYENLDNVQMRIHDYFKFLKFGFDRVTDWSCWHIRRGRLTRTEGVNLAKNYGGQFPWTYLGVDIREILQEIDLTLDEFKEICDQFTNRKLFKSHSNGSLLRDSKENLEKVNYDNISS